MNDIARVFHCLLSEDAFLYPRTKNEMSTTAKVSCLIGGFVDSRGFSESVELLVKEGEW